VAVKPRELTSSKALLDPPHFGLGIAVGSISGSPGETIGVGDGAGVAAGVSNAPLFVVNTPPESVTSSTRYKLRFREKSFASTFSERR
jgi:hypothetical protein